ASTQTRLDGKIHRSKLCTETQSIKCDARTVDVRTAFEIIDRPPNILATLNTYFAQLTLSARPIGVALVCFLVNRVADGATATDDELHKLQRQVPTGRQLDCIRTGKKYDGLVRGRDTSRQIQVQRDTIGSICSTK